MSLEDEIMAGFAAASAFAGESFTLSGRAGTFIGVFRGDNAPTAFDVQGYDVKTTNAVTVDSGAFAAVGQPVINERLTNSSGAVYLITAIEEPDVVNYDLQLQKVNA